MSGIFNFLTSLCDFLMSFFYLFKYVTASCSLLVSFRCFPLRHVIKFIDGLLFQFQTKTEFQETVTAFIEISSIWSLGLLFISVFDWLIFLWFAGQPALSILTCIRSRFLFSARGVTFRTVLICLLFFSCFCVSITNSRNCKCSFQNYRLLSLLL